jgi:signal transduction histidine kinase
VALAPYELGTVAQRSHSKRPPLQTVPARPEYLVSMGEHPRGKVTRDPLELVLQRAISRMRRLEAVTDVALSQLPLDELLDELLLRTRDLLEADTSAILLLDAEGKQLVARAAKGLEEEVERGVRIPFGQGFAGRIAAEGRPIVIADVDHADILNPILREKGIKSLIGAPLYAHDRVLGVIHAGTLARRDFTEEDAELLQVAAERAGLGIDRALVHEELVRLDMLQRDFIGFASHELRTPATVIYGVLETLRSRRQQLSDEQVAELEETLYTQSVRMKDLLERLLDLSMLDAGGFRIAPSRFHVGERTRELIKAIDPDLETDIRIGIPDDLETVADSQAFDRVVTNLLMNALRHGGPPVLVNAEQRDRHLRFVVEDRGPGIDEAIASQMFTPFTRGERSQRAGGVGLGLAIAHSYARAQGGDLRHEPVPQGARFEFVLPVHGVA